MTDTENKEIKIDDLRPAEGAVRGAKRKGRGISSGHGKTCCRGHRGEGQRAGIGRKPGFEGGQMPAYRKLPKLKGFELINPIVYAEINVCDLEEMGEEVVDINLLKLQGYFSQKYAELRVLGNGELTKKVTVRARHFSKSAKEKIEAAGGAAELV